MERQKHLARLSSARIDIIYFVLTQVLDRSKAGGEAMGG